MALTIDPGLCPQNHACPLVKLCPAGAISQTGHGLPVIEPRDASSAANASATAACRPSAKILATQPACKPTPSGSPPEYTGTSRTNFRTAGNSPFRGVSRLHFRDFTLFSQTNPPHYDFTGILLKR